MVSQEDIRKELRNHPNGMLQTELAKKIGTVNKRSARNESYWNPLMSLLKRKEIRREKAKNGGFIIFLNEENKEK
jgi:phosphotransacetylase